MEQFNLQNKLQERILHFNTSVNIFLYLLQLVFKYSPDYNRCHVFNALVYLISIKNIKN
jgi:hypothetical protein